MIGDPLGKGCYKIRVSITSKGKGKSGDARVIFFMSFFIHLFTKLRFVASVDACF